jgi:peptide/nickel transport system permease protein
VLGFITNRLANAVIVMLAVAFLAFTLANYVGDPVSAILGDNVSPAAKMALRHSLGLDEPLAVQFGRFLWRTAHGDFGISYQDMEPVSKVLAKRAPATLELSVTAMLLALGLGIPAGVYSALRPRSWSTRLVQVMSLVGISLPSFFTGILLILIFSVKLDWLASFGRGTTVQIGWWSTGLLTASGLEALILPAITLGLFQLTLIMRIVRAEMLEVLRTDYIRFARARGIRWQAINFGHALKNTLVPVITIAGLQLGSIIGFSVITETVFQWPGLGLLLIQAINFGDMPVLSAYLVLIAACFIGINLAVDLLYYAVDPRIRIDRASPA